MSNSLSNDLFTQQKNSPKTEGLLNVSVSVLGKLRQRLRQTFLMLQIGNKKKLCRPTLPLNWNRKTSVKNISFSYPLILVYFHSLLFCVFSLCEVVNTPYLHAVPDTCYGVLPRAYTITSRSKRPSLLIIYTLYTIWYTLL